jgi:hypothetical protein
VKTKTIMGGRRHGVRGNLAKGTACGGFGQSPNLHALAVDIRFETFPLIKNHALKYVSNAFRAVATTSET